MKKSKLTYLTFTEFFFYKNHPNNSTFKCKANRNVTEFEWLYLWKNNTSSSISPRQNAQLENMSKESWAFIAETSLRFPSENISAVIWVVKDSSGHVFNGSVTVTIKGSLYQ